MEIQINRKSDKWEIKVILFDKVEEVHKVVAGYYESFDGNTSRWVNKKDLLKFYYNSLPEPGRTYQYAEFWQEDPCVPEIERILNEAYPGCKIRWAR